VSVIPEEQVAANAVQRIDRYLRDLKHKSSGESWYLEDEMPQAIIAAAIVHGCNEIARAIREASK
jgi:hypothetical protein